MALLTFIPFTSGSTNTVEAWNHGDHTFLLDEYGVASSGRYNNQGRIVNAASLINQYTIASYTTRTYSSSDGVDVVFDLRKSVNSVTSVHVGILNHDTANYAHTSSSANPLVNPASGVWLRMTATGSISIYYKGTAVDDSATLITASPAFLTPTADAWYRYRIQYQGGVIRARQWEAGSAEPSTWNVNFTVPAGINIGSGSLWWATRNLSTASATAPTIYIDNVAVSNYVVDSTQASLGVIAPTVTADAYVTGNAPSTNNGSTNTFLNGTATSGGTYSYMNFDLSGIPAGATITQAYLRLVGTTSGTTATSGTISSMGESWTETGITYNNRPTTLTTLQTINPWPTSVSGTIVTLDVTAAVTALVAAGNTNGFAFAIGAPRTYASKEHTTTNYRPTLSVEYTTPATGGVTPVDDGYTAEPMTASATIGTATISTQQTVSATGGAATASANMPNAAITTTHLVHRNVAAGAATASASMPTAAVSGNAVSRTPTSDYSGSASTTATTLTTTDAQPARITFSTTGLPFPVISATLRLTISTGPGTSLTATPAGYLEGYNTVAGRPVASGTAADGVVTFDVTQTVKDWINGAYTNYGFVVQAPSGATATTVHSMEATNASQRPTLLLVMSDGTVVVVAPVVGTASATFVNPTVAVAINAGYVAQVMTATTLMPDPAITTTSNPDANHPADVSTATATMPGGAFLSPANINASPFTASADIRNATVTTERGALYFAQAAGATAQIIPPIEGQTEEFDPYFLRLQAQLPGTDDDATVDDLWFRLEELEGPLAENRLGLDGLFVGDVTYGVFGPEGRRAVHLDNGGYIFVPDNDVLTNRSRMEIIFRTDKATQTLATGSDYKYNNFAGNVRKTGLEMVDGKIRIYGGGNTFTGRTRLDDNQWHYVVWQMESGLSTIYIDGKLEMRRLLAEGGEINAVIDGIGGGPDRLDGQSLANNSALYFRGDITEFVYDKGATLSEHDIIGNYYAAFGITPVQAGVMSATATMPDGTKGKGNRKRALGLWYDPTYDPAPRTGERQSEYNWTGLVTSVNGTRTPHLNAYGVPIPFDMGEFKVFPKNVQRNEALGTSEYLGGLYYDEVTGEPRYLDVDTDIDTSDYDMVFFINLPPRVNLAAGYGENPSHTVRLYENLIGSVRKAQDADGFGIWAPQPEVALELGVVNNVHAHSMRRESISTADQGNAIGLYDPRGAQVNPWDGNPANGRYYFDNHALNRYRVTGLVEGLTDLPGWIDTDMFFSRPRDPFKPSIFGWKYADRTSGLQIGDEFMFGSQDEYDQESESSYLGAQLDRFSVISVPPAAVLAGTVVTAEAANYYVGSTLTENPYKDYATTIVVEPGVPVKGRPVNGRIFVNFMEGQEALGWTTYTLQMVPPNEEISNPMDHEDAAKRAWGYSTYRTSMYAISGSNPGATVEQEGTIANATGLDSRGFSTVVGVNINEKYPLVSLRRYGMAERGLRWLAQTEERAEGDKVIRVGAMTASTTARTPVVVAERDADVVAQPAIANARIVKPANVADPDVTVNVLPLVARADMTGSGRTVLAAPMTALAEIVENFDMVYAGGEQIVLTLLGSSSDLVLYIKEDA